MDRNFQEDLVFFTAARFKGSKVKDIAEYWIKRALVAEAQVVEHRKVLAEAEQAFNIALEEAQGEDWPEIRALRNKCHNLGREEL